MSHEEGWGIGVKKLIIVSRIIWMAQKLNYYSNAGMSNWRPV